MPYPDKVGFLICRIADLQRPFYIDLCHVLDHNRLHREQNAHAVKPLH